VGDVASLPAARSTRLAASCRDLPRSSCRGHLADAGRAAS
jgi:hypothetical protein